MPCKPVAEYRGALYSIRRNWWWHSNSAAVIDSRKIMVPLMPHKGGAGECLTKRGATHMHLAAVLGGEGDPRQGAVVWRKAGNT